MLGLSARHVVRLGSDGVIPSPIDGKFSLVECVRAYVGTLRARNDSAPLRSARLRKTQAQAQLAELELGRKTGEILPRDFVMKTWESIVLAVRQGFLGLPHRMAPRLQACADLREMIAALDAEVRRILEELSKGFGDEAKKNTDP